MSLENFPSFLLNFSEDEMNDEKRPRFRFKSFELDIAERQLLQSGKAVSGLQQPRIVRCRIGPDSDGTIDADIEGCAGTHGRSVDE